LKFLTIAIYLIYRILSLLGTIVCNKILFKFEDNKKQTLFKKKQALIFQIDSIKLVLLKNIRVIDKEYN